MNRDKWIGGVCSGIAYSIGVPTWIVRMVMVLSLVVFGFTFFLYVGLWIFMPRWGDDPSDYQKRIDRYAEEQRQHRTTVDVE